MFFIFKNGRLDFTSEKFIEETESITIEKDFTKEELNILYNGGLYIDGNIIDVKLEISKINKEFQNSIKQFTSNYSQVEIDSWDKKVDEAKKYLETGISTFISTLCIEGETETDLSNKILLNADLYATAFATAENIKRTKLNNLTIN